MRHQALTIPFTEVRKVSPGSQVPPVDETCNLRFTPLLPLRRRSPKALIFSVPHYWIFLPLTCVCSAEYPVTVQFLQIRLFNATVCQWSAQRREQPSASLQRECRRRPLASPGSVSSSANQTEEEGAPSPLVAKTGRDDPRKDLARREQRVIPLPSSSSSSCHCCHRYYQ